MRSHRSGGNLPPWTMRIRRKQRITATTLRSHRSGGLQGRHDSYSYQRALCGIIVRMRNALWRQIAAATTGETACSLRNYALVRDALWRQVAAATAKRDRVFLAELCSCTQCPVAADCRRYGEAGSLAPCGVMILCAMSYGGVDAAAAEYSNVVP